MKSQGVVVLAVVWAALVVGCERKKRLDEATSKISSDTAILEEATGAANAVIRNAADCDAVKAALPEANQKLQAAEGKLGTPAARATLDALRTQVRTVASACP